MPMSVDPIKFGKILCICGGWLHMWERTSYTGPSNDPWDGDYTISLYAESRTSYSHEGPGSDFCEIYRDTVDKMMKQETADNLARMAKHLKDHFQRSRIVV